MSRKKEPKYFYTLPIGWHYTIRPTHAIVTDILDTNIERSHRYHFLTNKRTEGLSQLSQQRIKRAVNILVWCAKDKWVFDKTNNKHWKFKVNFLTVTLPSAQIHDDKIIQKKIFEPFIGSHWSNCNGCSKHIEVYPGSKEVR